MNLSKLLVGAATLDANGVAQVLVALRHGWIDSTPDSERVTVMSLAGGEVESSTGIKVMSQATVAEAIETFILVGAAGMADRTFLPQTIDFVLRQRMRAAPAAFV